jgi:hypothetical protein
VTILSFDIEIKGLKELQRELEELKEGLTLSTVDHWCKKIENQAKLNCPEEHRNSIELTAIQIGSNRFDIRLKGAREALPYLERAIQANLSSMPLTTKALFDVLLRNVEQKISEGTR